MTDAQERLNFQEVKIRSLTPQCRIDLFKCGVTALDKWAKEKASKHHAQDRAKVFCAYVGDECSISAFYSLTLSSESADSLTDQYRDIYKRSGVVPLLYLSYLGVARSRQRMGLGGFMLADALRRVHIVSQHVAFYGVALRSLNDDTTKLYQRYGFRKKDGDPSSLMILPIWTIRDLIEGR